MKCLRWGIVFPDGGEEEKEADVCVGQDGELAPAQHCGQNRHQEAGREVPQEEGGHPSKIFFLDLGLGEESRYKDKENRL